ncbi:MAG TPA: Os1348 family NHLP clan protein [Streptosporangiaceae bacterium]|nr:Os1348 family NHLP clan protein [Streptosporangiaceae bacterium]HXS61969.1 Os1348 family NHLP clan protein [Streptosporangiaceae bacterium]
MTTAETTAQDGQPAQNQVKEVLERAIAEPEFAQKLLDDPDEALSGYTLTEVQLLLLRSLDEEDLAKLTPENLEEFFAVDSAVYTPEDARMVQLGYEMYDEEELEG